MGQRMKGSFDGSGLRIAVVVARFNEIVTDRLAEGCRDALARHGVRSEDVQWAEVPGSRELPVACKSLALTGRFDAVIALGCVIRGETVHFDLVANEASRGLGQASVETGVPVIFGVLATESLEQAFDRAGGKMGNAGWNAAVSAIETASVLERISKGTAG
ncbi:MAG TPA: 6,7-dimethyl-8-ribityllumazine synthase [Actinomycetota bacterium]|jgi:6,7-dimethyl-8-ribityllumazine synthase|nr:6,7-dimethyl-8-ribityllumazine synthase [Actinomycetota bacterium]